MMKKLPIATGNTANMPDANEPMRWLATVTTATQSETMTARMAMSERCVSALVASPSV